MVSESRGGKSDGPNWTRVSALAGVAAVIVALLGLAASQHSFPFSSGTSSSTTTPTSSTTTTPTSSTTTTPTSSTTTTPTSSTTKAQQPAPQVVWQHEFTFAFNASYGFDSFPPSKTDSANGFGVETTNTGTSNDIAFTTVGSNQAVQWTRRGQPSVAQCQDALASGGTGTIVIGPTGLSRGGWLCGQTDSGLIARFRYDSAINANSYTFFVTVWKPGQP